MPAAHEPHAVRLALATRPGVSQRVHFVAKPDERTVPSGHVVQLFWDDVWRAHLTPVGHSVPGGHMKGDLQAVCLLLTTFGSEHSWHAMPNVEKVVLLQVTQTPRSADGPVPPGHDSHAVRLVFIIFPGSVHRVQAVPLDRTVPIGQVVQLFLATLSYEQSPVVAVHIVPGGHRNGGVHDVPCATTIFGRAHRWHTPNCEYDPALQLVHIVRSFVGPVPAWHASHVTPSRPTVFGGQAWHERE